MQSRSSLGRWLMACWQAPRLRLLAMIVALIFTHLLLWRLVFAAWFHGAAVPATFTTLANAFVLGLRFDLRLTLILCAPVALALTLPRRWTPLGNRAARWAASAWLGLASMLIALVALTDLGHYAYLGTRLNASVLRFVEDFTIAAIMVWESYPVVWGALGLLALAGGATAAADWLLRRAARWPVSPTPWRWPGALAAGMLVLLLGGLGIYGKVILYPLRWSEAFTSDNPYVVGLGLNPALFFLDTLKVRQVRYDVAAVQEGYPLMARRLGLPAAPPATGPDYARHVSARPAHPRPVNVIALHLETQANYFMGFAGNPLDPTPQLDAIIRQSVHCTRAYAPAYGTARTVWALFTGIPDVSVWRTSSRNPLIASQHSLAAAFVGRDHFYFLGGSANWANIRGFMQACQPDLTIYEEGDYPDDPVVDVWGVSDLAMLRRAQGVLAARDGTKPFFAFLQTAGNHRPYTIPEDNAGFVRKELPQATLEAAGFNGNDQYNAVRLIDHFIGVWSAELRRSPWFRDTIVVLFGDHGTSGPRTASMDGDFAMGLTHLRVPLAIWAPGLGLEPRRIEQPATLVDILPTVAALAGVEHVNTTLGQDLLSPDLDPDRGVFLLVDEDRPRLGWMDRRFFYAVDGDGSRPVLQDRSGADPAADVSAAHPEVVARMSAELRAYYQTAQYLLEHNPPRAHGITSPRAAGAAGSP
jgi:phosphoglycerol transferase MdoB-like AlkP superfamily enzyme